jgi:hypothetical protein
MCEKCPPGARLMDCPRVISWTACCHCGRPRKKGHGCYGGTVAGGDAVFCYRQKHEPPVERVGRFKRSNEK